MKKHVVLIVYFQLFLTFLCYSQDDSMWIAGKTLKLGMQKNRVIDLISMDYDLKPLPNDKNTMAIITKDGPPFLPMGLVKFQADKLVHISKNWGQYEGKNIVEFGKTLNTLISKLNDQGKVYAIVKSKIGAREPNYSSNQIEIIFGKHKIQIDIAESSQYGNNIAVFESISE